jgi:hypothetical protein
MFWEFYVIFSIILGIVWLVEYVFSCNCSHNFGCLCPIHKGFWGGWGGGNKWIKSHCRTREHKKFSQGEKPTPNQGARPQPLLNKITPFRDLISSPGFLAIPGTNGMGTTMNQTQAIKPTEYLVTSQPQQECVGMQVYHINQTFPYQFLKLHIHPMSTVEHQIPF